MNSRKAQIKFGETLGIIFIVYLVIVMGVVWYNNVNQAELQELYQKNQEEQAFETYGFFSTLVFLRQSERGRIDQEFDIIGLRTLYEYSNSSPGQGYLQQRIGNAVVRMSIYNHTNVLNAPDPQPQETILLYNQTPREADIEEIQVYRTMVPVRSELEKKTHLGVLEVSVPLTR